MSEFIRPLGPEDRLDILELYGQLTREYPHPLGAEWTPEKLKKELVATKGLGIFEEQNLQGFILYRTSPEAREISLLATRKAVQGRGFMTKLLSHFVSHPGPAPATVWLEVHVENIPARALYKKLGFIEQGLRKSYYKDGKDAVLCEYKSLQ